MFVTLHLDGYICQIRYAGLICCFFFFQAEDGIRDYKVTGVQTCALPICARRAKKILAKPQEYKICEGCDSIVTSRVATRSEEHTSELQSPCNLVCRLLLEKKKERELAIF